MIDKQALKAEKKTAAEKAAKAQESKTESFKFIKAYAYRECGSIVIGILFLIGGSLSDLAIPYFIGQVIDLLTEEDFDGINTLCLYMIIVIVVSSARFKFI